MMLQSLDDIAEMASIIYWTDMARNVSLVDMIHSLMHRICVFFSDKLSYYDYVL